MSTLKFPSEERHWTLLMLRQHWFRQWLDAVGQQTITRTNIDPGLFRHMVSPGHNELIHWGLVTLMPDKQIIASNFFI